MPNPRCSIVVVTYNSAAYIGPCLASVFAAGGDFELIVVDNASTDETAAIVAEQPGVRLVQSVENDGFGAALNRGVTAARAEVVVALNPDCVVEPGWLEALAVPLDDERVGATTARILFPERPVVNACGNDVHITGVTTCRLLGREADAAAVLQGGAVGAVSGACFAVRKEVWLRIGGMYGALFLYLEDTEFSLRLYGFGYCIRYVPSAVVRHDYRPRFSATKFTYLERNRWLLLVAVFPPGLFAALAPALVAAELLSWGAAARYGPPGLAAKMQALRGAFALLPSARNRQRSLPEGADARILAVMRDELVVDQVGGRLGLVAARALLPLFRLAHTLAARRRGDWSR